MDSPAVMDQRMRGKGSSLIDHLGSRLSEISSSLYSVFFSFGPQAAVLKAYSWFYAQGSLLPVPGVSDYS